MSSTASSSSDTSHRAKRKSPESEMTSDDLKEAIQKSALNFSDFDEEDQVDLAETLKRYINKYKTISVLREKRKEWQRSAPPVIASEFEKLCGEKSPSNDQGANPLENTKEFRPDLKMCVARWKTYLDQDLKEMKKQDHQSNFSEAKIIEEQHRVYSCLADDKKIPCDPRDILNHNMLFAPKYKRVYDKRKEPVYTTIVRSKVQQLSYISEMDNLSEEFENPSRGGEYSPLRILIQQRGAGKSFEIYNLSKSNFVLFFSMTTQKNDKTVDESASQDICVMSYYEAIRQIFKKTTNVDLRYSNAATLTIKLVFAAMLHLYIWKLYMGQNAGYRDWFEYSMGSRETLRKIFNDLQDYRTGSIRETILDLEEFSDRKRYVICFDEAGELTTDKPTSGMMFRRRKNDETQPITEEDSVAKYTLFHPFVEGLISLSAMGMYRLLCGTTLSLSRVSLGYSSALKADEVSIVILNSLADTTLKEIKDQIISYFPSLNLDLHDSKLRRFVGRSRYLYDILLPSLFKISKGLTGTKALKLESFQEKFDDILDNRLNFCISLYEDYVKGYMENESLRYLDDEQTSKGIMNKVLYDIVLGSVNPRTVSPKECAAILDYGLMRCMNMNGTQIELVQREYIASQAIISYYTQRDAGSKKQRISKGMLCDPILEHLMAKFQEDQMGTITGYTFELFMMRYFQVSCYLKHSVAEVEYIKLFKDPTLKYYRMDAYHFMSQNRKKEHVSEKDVHDEKIDGSKIKFVEYLERIEEFVDAGYFPPNNAGPDGVIPIIRRPFKEVSGISEGEYNKLPRIRLLCFQFKFLTASNLSKKKMLHAIKTTDPDKFYFSKGEKDLEEVKTCRNIFSRPTHPLYKASEHCLRYVVTSGNVGATAEKLFEGSKVVLIRADRNSSIDREIGQQFVEICQQNGRIEAETNKQKSRELFATAMELYAKNDLANAIEFLEKEIKSDHNVLDYLEKKELGEILELINSHVNNDSAMRDHEQDFSITSRELNKLTVTQRTEKILRFFAKNLYESFSDSEDEDS